MQEPGKDQFVPSVSILAFQTSDRNRGGCFEFSRTFVEK